ncbi:serine--tRNA ligase, partial [Elusimicrobiota bacterium]
MLDINRIRKETESVKKGLSLRGQGYEDKIDLILKLDEGWRRSVTEAEELKSRRNKVSAKIGQLKESGENAQDAINEMKYVSDKIKELDEIIRNIKTELDNELLFIPNIPAEGIEKEDKVIREAGVKNSFSFMPRTHWELGEELEILDFKAAATLSGSRFA